MRAGGDRGASEQPLAEPSGRAPTLAGMTEVTFSEMLDWLDGHKGQRIVVEVGCRDPRIENADFAVLQVHTTLGAMRIVDDREHGTGVTRIPFEDGDAIETGGIEIDQACFQRAKIHLGLLKVWQHDVYVVLRPIGGY